MKTLILLLIAASGAHAGGLERMAMHMRALPGLAAAPTAGMERLAVSTRKNAARMKNEQLRVFEKGIVDAQAAAKNSETGAKLSRHLLKFGNDGFDLFDQPARCLGRARPEGQSGVEMLACQQFAPMPETQDPIRHAVVQNLIGDVTVYYETWTQDKAAVFKIEQYSFLFSARGELLEAVKTVFAAGKDEQPYAVTPAEELDRDAPQLRAILDVVSQGVLRTLPQTRI